MAALLAGWLIDGVLEPLLGMGFTFFVSFVVSTLVFFKARTWLLDLRGR